MTNRNSQVGATQGFTLIEVLLTLVLAAALLAGLWTLLSMHLRLFDTGQTKTEQSQLARTLLAQMSEDLHSIVQMPPPPPPAPPLSALVVPGMPLAGSNTGSSGSSSSTPPNPANAASAPPPQSAGTSPSTANPNSNSSPPSPRVLSNSTSGNSTSVNASSGAANANPTNGNTVANGNASLPPPNTQPAGANVATTSSLRPSGLFGTEDYLQIDVRQSTIVRPEVEPDERPLPGVKRRTRAAELRTVVYTFEEMHDPVRPPAEPHMVLTRRELDWEQAHAAPRVAARQPAGPFAPAVGADAVAASEPLSPEVRSEGANDETSAVMPEVTQFGMRYFDGSQWFKEWDSSARKGLPVAIEVAVQLRAFDDLEQPPHHLTNDPASEEAKPPQLPIYRLVIHLPAAIEPAPGNGQTPMVNIGGRGGAERPLGEGTNGARR